MEKVPSIIEDSTVPEGFTNNTVENEQQEGVSQETVINEINLEEATQIAEGIADDNDKLIEIAHSTQGATRTRSMASVIGTMALAVGMGAGLGHSEDANAAGNNVLKGFGDQVTQGVNRQIIEAGRDSGGVMGGAMRVVITRGVNTMTEKGLAAAGVPVARAPEQVVVVPRSIENPGAVYQTNQVYGAQVYGTPQYGPGVVVQRGVEGGFDLSAANQMKDLDARYATEKSRLMIEANSHPEQQLAQKEKQELELMRLDKSFKEKKEKAKEQDKMLVMKEWTAAKAQMLATHKTQSIEGRIAELDKRYAQNKAAIQIQAERRAKGQY